MKEVMNPRRKKIHKYQIIKKHLQDMIGRMRPGHNKLDTEEIIAAKMGASKATVRQAITELIAGDLITRVQGKGVFGRPMVSRLKMRIHKMTDFLSLLVEQGYRVSVLQGKAEVRSPSACMIKRVPGYAGEDVYAYVRTYYADEAPVILCRVEVPMSRVAHSFDSNVPNLNFNDDLKELCGISFTYAVSWIRASLDKQGEELFQVEKNTPFVTWDEVFLDIHDQQICYNEILFHPHLIDMSIISYF